MSDEDGNCADVPEEDPGCDGWVCQGGYLREVFLRKMKADPVPSMAPISRVPTPTPPSAPATTGPRSVSAKLTHRAEPSNAIFLCPRLCSLNAEVTVSQRERLSSATDRKFNRTDCHREQCSSFNSPNIDVCIVL